MGLRHQSSYLFWDSVTVSEVVSECVFVLEVVDVLVLVLVCVDVVVV